MPRPLNQLIDFAAKFAILTSILMPHALADETPKNIDENIDEIVVTTTRSQSLRRDNAGNIAILNTDTDDYNFTAELVNRAPGVLVHRGSGQEHLTAIRSPILVGGAGAGSFLYLEDSIPLRAAGFANINALMDAMPEHSAHIEVIRGPGSALYGSNAVHGLINFISRKIQANEDSLDVKIGAYGRYQLATSSARQLDNLSYRTSVTLSGDEEGYRADQGYEKQGVRLQLQTEKRATSYNFSFAGTNLNQETAGYIQTQNCGDGTQEAYEVETCAKSNPNPEAYRDARSFRTSLRIERTFANGAQLRITPYARSNKMEFLLHFLPGQAVEKNEHQSIGTQIAYANSSGKLDYIIGVDSEVTIGSLSEVQTADNQFGRYLRGTHYDYEVEASTFAPFMHLVLHAAPPTQLTFGLRAEATRYVYDTKTTGADLQGFLYRPVDSTNEFTDVSPKFGIVHNFVRDHRIFVNLARATRAPQTTDLYRLRDSDTNDNINPNISDINSETLDSLEIGFRGARASFSYEVSGYTMRKKNHHFRDAQDTYETNGKTRHQGIEFDFDWRILKTLSLVGNVSRAKHTYEFDRNISGINATETIIRGNTIDSAPKTLANMRLNWQARPRINISWQWAHVSRYFLDASNSAEYDGHDLFDLNIDFKIKDNITASLNLANIFDTAYATRADKWRGENRYFPGEGRRLSLGLKTRF